MALKDIVNPKKSEIMPDRVWETYDTLVSVCNALNAQAYVFRRDGNRRQQEHLSFLLERAQTTIMELLEETGRLKEYDEWRESHSKQPS